MIFRLFVIALLIVPAGVASAQDPAAPAEDAAPAAPDEAAQPADPFAGDGPFEWQRGAKIVLRNGGSHKRLNAVRAALDWLARHQDDDGRWSGADFDAHCVKPRCPGFGAAGHDVGLTGLSLLAFLGAGEPQDTGAHGDTVRRGLEFLKSRQDEDGFFGRGGVRWTYDHMIATLAMVEAYGMTGSDLYRASAERGVRAVRAAQNPYLAWRYGVRDGDNDTSVTVWGMLVLRVAQEAGIATPDGAFRDSLHWIELMTESEFGRVGYQLRGGPSSRTEDKVEGYPPALQETLTGMGVLARVLAGADAKRDEWIKKGVALVKAIPPRWAPRAGAVDLYGWQFGSLAMFQVGGGAWTSWSKALGKALSEGQERGKGCARGSWFGPDAWTEEGGRIYATSMGCLALLAHARYPRLRPRR